MVHVYLIRCCAILVILCELQEYPIIFLFTCHANTILPNIDCVLVIVERHLVGRKGSTWITMLMKMTVKMMDYNAVLMKMVVISTMMIWRRTSRSATRVFLLESFISWAAQRLSTSSSIWAISCHRHHSLSWSVIVFFIIIGSNLLPW